MALPLFHVYAEPRPESAAFATIADYLRLWLTTSISRGTRTAVRRLMASVRLALGHWLLQRRARRALRRGECHAIAELIAAGNWAALDALTDGWVSA